MSNFRKFLLTIFVAILALMSEFVFQQPQIAYWLVATIGGLTTISMFLGMIETLKSGKYGVDILAITAIIATLLVGQYWASLMVLIMLTGGDSLEDFASKQAGRELRALLDNSPQLAHVVKKTDIKDVPVDKVALEDIVLVKPGELVPVDGIVLKGKTTVDESSLTGESQPIEKKVGDELMSGSLNGDGAIHFKVTKKAVDSQYQTLVKLVKESAEKPAHFVRLADRYAIPFTLVAYLIGGISWFVSKNPSRFAEVLVVASPCPLILAAPVALVAGMSRSSRHGIVVKTGTTIEKLAKSQTIAFDKTGTLTEGKLSVSDIHTMNQMFSKEEILTLAASCERESVHILARSLVVYANENQMNLLPVEDLKEVTGSGVEGKVKHHLVRVGNASFVNAPFQNTTEKTVVYVGVDDECVGYISFKDVLRTEANKTISHLKELGLKRIVMLTGDNLETAKDIASKVGIKEIHAKCLPEEKIQLLNQLKDSERPSVMVGDGVNDAPALAVADVGIAMGAHGSTAASESADAVILKEDLSCVSKAVEISQDTMKIARQSVLIGIFICVVLMFIASTGAIPALLGAALQEVIDTVSILSALRARKD